MHEHENHERDELAWLAFCYVANELDDAARTEFELRLAESQAAREAVAQAVELVAAAQLAGACPAAPAATHWNQVAVRCIAAVAAAVVLFITFGHLPFEREQAEPTVAAHMEARLLAEAWLKTRQAFRSAEPDSHPVDVQPAMLEPVADELPPAGEDEGELIVSDWMMVALLDMQHQGGEGSLPPESQP